MHLKILLVLKFIINEIKLNKSRVKFLLNFFRNISLFKLLSNIIYQEQYPYVSD
jgi:hypothetical protein